VASLFSCVEDNASAVEAAKGRGRELDWLVSNCFGVDEVAGDKDGMVSWGSSGSCSGPEWLGIWLNGLHYRPQLVYRVGACGSIYVQDLRTRQDADAMWGILLMAEPEDTAARGWSSTCFD
jgi:hypothetical protein